MRYFSTTFMAFILIVILISVSKVSAQWTQTGPQSPTSGYVNFISASGKFVLAATGQQIFESADTGKSWTSNPETLQSLQAFAILNGNIIAATTTSIYLSTDQGMTWTKEYSIGNGAFSTLAVSDGYVLAGTAATGIYRSSDGGVTWTPADSGLGNPNVVEIASSDSTVIAGTGGGVYKSTDNGSSWSASDSGTIVNYLAIRDSLICLVGDLKDSSEQEITVSANNGATWTTVNSPSSQNNITGTAIISSTIFIATDSGSVYRSTDAGAIWDSVNTVSPFSVEALASGGGNLYAGTSGAGVYSSSDSGLSWNRRNTGLSTIDVYAFAVESGRLFAGTDAGIFVTTDGGGSWSLTDSGLTNSSVHSLMKAGANVLAATGGGIFVSTDNGESWFSADPSVEPYSAGAFAAYGSEIYAAISASLQSSTGGLLKSGNNGLTWSDGGNFVPDMGSLTVLDNTLFAGNTIGGGVFALSDTGGWVNRDNGLANKYVVSLIAVGKKLVANTQGGPFESSDDGNDWVKADTASTGGIVNAVLNVDGSIFGGSAGGVYRSTDDGSTWTKLDSGLVHPGVISMIAVGDTMFVGLSDGGVWKRPLSQLVELGSPKLKTPQNDSIVTVDPLRLQWHPAESASSYRLEVAYDSGFVHVFFDTSVAADSSASLNGITSDTTYYWRVEASDTFGTSAWSETWTFKTGTVTEVGSDQLAPLRFGLSQNYPNPFNPTTVISYQLSAVSRVSLKVYDVLGRSVGTLVNKIERPGSYKVEFNAADLPSGVYFYRLQAGSFSKTMKLMVLK